MSAATTTPDEAHNITVDCDHTSQDNQTTFLFHALQRYGQTVPVLICIFVLLTFFSCVINVLTFFSIGRSDDLSWQPRFTFYKNLIFSDLIQTLTIGPSVVYGLLQRRTVAQSFWCYFQYFVGSVSIFSSLVTITCMTLERYLYICFAMQYLPLVTEKRLRLALLLIWVYSISIVGINLSLMLHAGIVAESEQAIMGLLCEADIIEQHIGSPRAPAIFRKVIGLCTLVLCLLAHAFSYCRMYEEARNAAMPFKAVNAKARKTVMFYSGMLFLQVLPLLIKVISDVLWEFQGSAMLEKLHQYRGTCEVKEIPSTTAAVLHVSMLTMLLVPPCINPLVYGLRNVEIRKTLRNLVPWKRLENRIALPLEIIREANHLDQN